MFFRRIIILLLLSFVIISCAGKKPVYKIDQYVWPKESADPKLKAVRVITNSNEFPGKTGGKNAIMKELVGDINVNWIDIKAIRLATNGEGKVYIAVPAKSELQLVDFVNKRIKNIRFSSIKPSAVAVKGKRIFIGDRAGGRVMEITEDKNVKWSYGRKVDEKAFEKMKNDNETKVDNLYKRISDVFVKGDKLYVTDELFGRIDILSLDGKYIKSIYGVPAPNSIYVGDNGKIYVLSKFVGKLFVYDKNGNFIKDMLTPGTNIWALNFPNGLAMDSEDHIFIIDIATNGLKIYDKEGTFLYYLGVEKESVYLGGFNNPKDVIVDNKDRVYILDSYNRRLVILQSLTEKYKNGRRDMTVKEPMLRW
ncbi:MAG TPA: hypothetical protein DHM44_09350 [Flexistipes sinusarabici]|uniref:NHL repeat containing protein n=1 Tax=Flexistipes sinusarabici TaxID=2352 RepID=A0A3D5QFD4_FLESI|nr:hypothetical protein [Flexistipes sinusarabici]